MTNPETKLSPPVYRLLVSIEEHGPEGNRQIGEQKQLLEVDDLDVAIEGIRAIAIGPQFCELVDQAIALLDEVLASVPHKHIGELIRIKTQRAVLHESINHSAACGRWYRNQGSKL
jgi:hypothetical protein